ncbi:MAG: hypothetical protein ACI91G_001389 [Gammaproteobacteria bacterium]
MTEQLTTEEQQAVINNETAQIQWRDLERFFAAGQAVYVDERLDLVEVATAFIKDDKPLVEGWLTDKLVLPVPDDIAAAWYEADTAVWSVVARPWVLVQQRS